MTKYIQNTIKLLFLLIPLFVFSQKIDSAYVHGSNHKARALEREGKFSEAYMLVNDIILRLKKQYKSEQQPLFNQTKIEVEKNFGNYEDSIKYYHDALKYLAFSYQTKAGIERNLGDYEKSIKTSRNALQICLQLKDTFNIAYNYNLIGVGYYFLSEYDSTKMYYEKSYELRKRIKVADKVLAVSAYNLAILYEDLVQPEKALKLYKDAEHYLLKSKETKSFLSDVYVGIAHLYFYRKEINKAEEYSEKAIDVGLKSYGEYNPNMTFVYTSYANILESKEKYKEAIILLEKSLKIRENTYGEYHKWTCESNYKLAEVLALDKQYDKAEVYFIKAIDVGEKVNSIQFLANAKTYLAKLYIDQDINFDEAEELLLSALNINIGVFGYKNNIIAEVYYYLAQIAKKRNQKDKLLAFVTRTLNSASYDKNNLNQVIAPYNALDAIVLMGDWYKDEYNRTKKIDLLKNKYQLIDEELALIKFSQKNFSSDQSKIKIANEYRDIFEKGLNTCWELYHTTSEQKYLEKAFELSETNRNTTLLEGLQDLKYKLFGDVPSELLGQENKIKQDLELAKLDLYYEKSAQAPDKEFISSLLNQRILLSNKLDSLHKTFEKDYPRYSNLKYANKVIKISDVQSEIDNNTQLLTYFLGEDDLYSFIITKDKVSFLKGNIADKLIDNTIRLKKNLITRKDIKNISEDLHLYLLGQQLHNTKSKLVIIPDNVLNYIPFEILLNDNDRFLIDDYSICYSGSVHLFLELKNDFFNYSPPNYWAGFSPKYEGDFELSSISDEISTISKIVKGKNFIGEASKKQSFLDNNKDFSILHLAMHAEIDNENPMFNKLIFSDGELTSSEIYLSNTKANLAVLSACNTGFGKLEKGEGVMSMARAFHFSGVPSVIMSLWKVPDKETNQIMIAFYKHLKSGETKSEALKNAKLDFLKTTSDINLKHPYYWSGFVLNGNSNKLIPTKKYNYFLIGLVIIAIVLVVIKWIKK